MIRYRPYWTCPYCEANLDPGERCDCRDTPEEKKQAGIRQLPGLPNTRICVNNNINYKEDNEICQQH